MKMYEEYKDSGVKWIGEVPNHWKIAPIKRFLSGMQDGTHGTYQTVDSGYPLLSAKNVFDTGLCIEDAERKISKDDYYSIIANGYPQKAISLCVALAQSDVVVFIMKTFPMHFSVVLLFKM